MKVLLGLCGSIAAYKSLELARLLIKKGAEVRFVLTRSALNFVTPLCCQTLSNNEVYVDQFVLNKGIKHLSLSEWADIFVIAPATANIIGKAACGIGDDLISTTLLSMKKPVLFVPAMDTGMWDNPIVQKNVAFLNDAGYHFLQPGFGALASGKIGRGRFPSVEMIARKVASVYEKRSALGKKKFLVTGGRTEEDLDPVRVLTNRSSGTMAAELIQAIHCRGGDVRGIIGEVSCRLPQDVDIKRVRTSEDMLGALRDNFDWCDFLIMAAAVGDYRPGKKSSKKVHERAFRMDLQKNRDLLREISKCKVKQVVVGFSLEDKEQHKRAREKMKAKSLDIVVMNSAAAIGADRAAATILTKGG
ncbi:MAG: bifunctional phosphopantothenoylcysteine decarboxylase/phosphopantothenate--cysteine ligase CoaBC, partial [candidate division WOR-3 bacterium]